MSTKSFRYSDPKRLIDINTLGPNNNYYYKVQKPISINMSNFACKIAFYNINSELIYHRAGSYAHWLEPWQKIELVKWSFEGNIAYYYEYSRNSIYNSVFLNLKDEYCYRIDEMKDNFNLVKSLNLKDRNFSEKELMTTLDELGLIKNELFKDKVISGNIFNKILDQDKWFPQTI